MSILFTNYITKCCGGLINVGTCDAHSAAKQQTLYNNIRVFSPNAKMLKTFYFKVYFLNRGLKMLNPFTLRLL